MKNQIITLAILVLLTLISAMLANGNGAFLVIGILVLAVFKFIGVSFYFMELKQANGFWKGSVLVFLMLFISTVLIIFYN